MQTLKMENVKIPAETDVKLCFDTTTNPEYKIIPLINLSNLAPSQNIKFAAGVGFIVLTNESKLDWMGNVYLTFDKSIPREIVEAQENNKKLTADCLNILMYRFSNVLFNFSQCINTESANKALDELYSILHEYEKLVNIDYHTPDFRQQK